MDCKDWHAWYNRMPGTNDRNLYVSGVVALSSSSIRVWLAPGNEGIVPQPDLVALELKAEYPDVGDTQYVEVGVEWRGNVGRDPVKTVRIQGECSANIDVEIVDG